MNKEGGGQNTETTKFTGVAALGGRVTDQNTQPANFAFPSELPMKYHSFLCCDCYVRESTKVDGVMLHIPLERWKWLLVVTNVPFFYMSILFLVEPSSSSNLLERVVVSILCAMCGGISTYFHWIQCYVNPISRATRTALLLDMVVCGVSGLVMIVMVLVKGLMWQVLLMHWPFIVLAALCISPQFSALYKLFPCLPTPDGLMYTITHSAWHVFAAITLMAVCRAIVLDQAAPLSSLFQAL